MTSEREDPDLGRLLQDAAWVRSLAIRLVGDHHLAEDLSQEALLAELSRSNPRAGEPRRSWLAAVLRNLAKMQRRGSARRHRRERESGPGESVPSAAEIVEQTELQQRVVAEVLALPEPYRGTLLLRYAGGHTIEEIARRQGVAPATVRSRSHRGIAMLRERMRGALGSSWRRVLLALAIPGAPVVPGPTPSVARTTPTWAQPLLLGVSMKLALKSGLAIAAVGLVLVTLHSLPGDPSVPSLPPASDRAPADALRTVAAEPSGPRRVPLLVSDPTDSAPAPRYTGPGTVLHGVVLARTERPIESAEVVVLGAPLEALESGMAVQPVGRATSDAQGAFAIGDLPPSVECVLHVTAAGYAPAWMAVRPGDGATVWLDRAARLFGTVVDAASRQPVPGVRIRTRAVSIARDRLGMLAESISDARGRYELAGLPVGGPIALEVLRSGSAPLALRVVLRGDPDTRHDILLRDLGTVEGVVVTGEGQQPVAGAQIRSRGAGARVLAETDERGRFTLRLHSRPAVHPRDAMLRGQRVPQLTSYHTIAVHARGFCQTIQPLAPLIASERAVKIPLLPSGGLVGVVEDGQGAPVSGASVYWVVPGQIPAEPGGWIEPGPTSQRARTDDDGSFSLPEVLPGIPLASLAVRRAHHPPHRVIDVAPREPGEVREVVIRLDTGVVVRGRTFLNGKAAVAYVHLDGSAGPKSGIMMSTDADGHFAFHGVLPGDYTIKSCTADGTAVWSDPLALRVAASPPASLELAIAAPFDVVAGRVVTADGQPVANSEVFVFPGEETSGILAGMAKTDADGVFEARLPPDGEKVYTIAMAWEGFRVFVSGVHAGTRNVRLVAPTAASIAVVLVRDRTLEPIRTATLAFRRGAEEPWSTLFGGREVSTEADGALQLRLPVGDVELRVASPAAGIDPTTRDVRVTEGARLTLRM